VVDKLSYETDFLVLGVEPQLPKERKGDEKLDFEKIQKDKEKLAKYNEYRKLLSTAKEMGIPVLDQNRFLTLVGYYQRMPGGTVAHHE
jgi:hypothetical protein